MTLPEGFFSRTRNQRDPKEQARRKERARVNRCINRGVNPNLVEKKT